MILNKVKLSSAILFIKMAIAKCAAVALLALSMVPNSHAREKEWWFEVEVVLFKHIKDANQLSESFKNQQQFTLSEHQIDLIYQYLQPDISTIQGALPVCSQVPPKPLWAQKDWLNVDPILLDQSIPISSIHVSEVESSTNLEPSPYAQISSESPDIQSDSEGSTNTQQSQFVVSVAEESTLLDPQEVSLQPDNILDEQSSLALVSSPIDLEQEQAGEEASQSHIYNFAFEFYQIHMADFDVTKVTTPIQLDCTVKQPLFTVSLMPPEKPTMPDIISTVPALIDGAEWLYQNSAYLMSAESLQLAPLVSELKRTKNVRPMLHMGWRQEVLFDEKNAKPVRLFAGTNYAEQFDREFLPLRPLPEVPYIDPYPVVMPESVVDEFTLENADMPAPEQLDLIDSIRQALNFEGELPQSALADIVQDQEQQDRTDQIWELEGSLKVFLKYIQGTPYLHIDSEFDFRAPVFDPEIASQIDLQDTVQSLTKPTDNVLQGFHFKQLRRIISTQVHYFDHPLFGMVVQVRRHERPKPETNENPTEIADQ